MNVIYAKQQISFDKNQQYIFLVGPTPRSQEVMSWRPKALEILDKGNYKGTVFVPEPKDRKWLKDYNGQVEWEHEALEICSKYGCIAAWVPRDLDTMPAFTTNVEFGLYIGSGRLLYGRPENSPKNRYLDWVYINKTQRLPHHNLESLMLNAVNMAEGES